MKLVIASHVQTVIFFIFFFKIIFCEELKINSDYVANFSGNNVKNIVSEEYNIKTENENGEVIIDKDNIIDQHSEYAESENNNKTTFNLDLQNDIDIEKNVNKNNHQENDIKKNNNQQDNLSFRDILINLMLPHFKEEYVEEDSDKNIDVNNILRDDFEVNLAENVSVIENSLQLHITEAEGLNNTVGNSTATNNTTSKKSFCIDIDNRDEIGDVEIINSTTLQSLLIHDANISSRTVPSRCYLIYFFSPYCPFSTQGSAYVNALARSLKNIPIYGLDSITFHSMNARYGVMGTPSLILFHNGNVVARYNASEYSTFNLEAFIHHFSNQVADSINVTSHDFKALLPSKVTPSSPFALYIAWVFLITCGGWVFFNSEFYAKLKEAVLNNWREAEAQHAHDD